MQRPLTMPNQPDPTPRDTASAAGGTTVLARWVPVYADGLELARHLECDPTRMAEARRLFGILTTTRGLMAEALR
jgi:hypothetical protein